MLNCPFVVAGIAAILHFILGSIWYAKSVFGNAWMKSIGLTDEDCKNKKNKGMIKAMIICFITSSLLAASTVHFVMLSKVHSVSEALLALICPAIGFILAPIAMGIEFEGKKWTYFFITGGYLVLGMAIAGSAAAIVLK